MIKTRRRAKADFVAGALATLTSAFLPAGVAAQPANAKKPNIIVIFADDVGPWNVSAYHRGMMGGRTPNIDRIASEGALFTDYYAQQSCTAGRSAFITGQHPFRTGLLRAGFPAAKQGMQDKDPTIAELLKPLRLRHQPDRQEPPRRPQRVPAHRPRLRRVLSATSTT